MKTKMTLTEAIHLMSEEAVQSKKLADDIAETMRDKESVEYAKNLHQRAEALEMLVRIARVWNEAGQE